MHEGARENPHQHAQLLTRAQAQTRVSARCALHCHYGKHATFVLTTHDANLELYLSLHAFEAAIMLTCFHNHKPSFWRSVWSFWQMFFPFDIRWKHHRRVHRWWTVSPVCMNISLFLTVFWHRDHVLHQLDRVISLVLWGARIFICFPEFCHSFSIALWLGSHNFLCHW